MTRATAGLMLGALLAASVAPTHAAPQMMRDCSPVSVSSGASPCHHAAPLSCDRAPGCAGLTVALRPSVSVLPVLLGARFTARVESVMAAGLLRTGPPTPPPNS